MWDLFGTWCKQMTFLKSIAALFTEFSRWRSLMHIASRKKFVNENHMWDEDWPENPIGSRNLRPRPLILLLVLSHPQKRNVHMQSVFTQLEDENHQSFGKEASEIHAQRLTSMLIDISATRWSTHNKNCALDLDYSALIHWTSLASTWKRKLNGMWRKFETKPVQHSIKYTLEWEDITYREYKTN